MGGDLVLHLHGLDDDHELALLDLVALGRDDVGEVDVVAVGVDPVGQHVVGHRTAGFHGDCRAQVLLLGRRVLVGVANADLDARTVGATAPVIDRVRERRRGACGVLRHRQLQRLPVLHHLHAARFGLIVDRDREDIAVLVRVVVEHGEHGGPAGARAVLVVLRDGGRVLRRALGRLDLGFVGVGDLVGVLAVALGRRQIIPVVDDLHRVRCEPRRADRRVVQCHLAAVRPEDEAVIRCALHGLREVVRGSRAVADDLMGALPRGVRTAVDDDGLGWPAGRTAVGRALRLGSVERHRDERARRRDANGVASLGIVRESR